MSSDFIRPEGIALDSLGNIYVADSRNNSVKMVDFYGKVVTLYDRLNHPAGIAVDPLGNVYVADTGSNTIKKIYVNGTVVILGGKFNQPRSVLVDGEGNIFVADAFAISEWTETIPASTPTPVPTATPTATIALMSTPSSMRGLPGNQSNNESQHVISSIVPSISPVPSTTPDNIYDVMSFGNYYLLVMPFVIIAIIAYFGYGFIIKRGKVTRKVIPGITPLTDGSGQEDKLVFISYAKEDRKIAEAICHRMEDNNIGCWIFSRDQLPGAPFEKPIIKAIHASKVFVIVYSSHSNESLHVESEVRMAWNMHIPIINFRIEDVAMSEVLLYYIGANNWLNAMAQPLETHIDALIKTTRELLENKK